MHSFAYDATVKPCAFIASVAMTHDPDSTTGCSVRVGKLWRRSPFVEGEDVFVHNVADGLMYFGVIVEVDEDVLQCLVRFPDCTEKWSPFWDVRRLGEKEPQDEDQQEDQDHLRIKRLQQNLRTPSLDEDDVDEEEEVAEVDVAENDVEEDEDEDDDDEESDDEPRLINTDDYYVDPDFHLQTSSSGGQSRTATSVPATKAPRTRGKRTSSCARRGRQPRTTPQPLVRQPTPDRVKRARKELPYKFDNLVWDANHTRNDHDKYCYCGESGDWYRKMLQCNSCLQWFHQECLRTSTLPILFGDRFFDFCCALCGPVSKATDSGEETLVRLDMSWVEALHIVLFHLTVMNSKKFHDVEMAVIPFFRRKCKALQGPACLLKSSRVELGYINQLLLGNKSRFKCGSEINKRSDFWSLRKVTPPAVPNKYGGVVPVEIKCKGEFFSISSKRVNSKVRKGAAVKSAGAVPVGPHFPPRRRGRPPSKKPRGDSLENSEYSDDTSSRGTLDSFIPPPKNFEGTNNPFRNLGLFCAPLPPPAIKVKSFLESSLAPADAISVDVSSGESPKCEKAGGVVVKTEPGSLLMIGQREAVNGLERGVVIKTEPDLEEGGVGADKSGDKLLSDLKCSLNSYFGAETRISKGERFSVLAKRLNIDGDVQRLIEWEQPNPLSPNGHMLTSASSVSERDKKPVLTSSNNCSGDSSSNGDSGIASPTNSSSGSNSISTKLLLPPPVSNGLVL